MRASEINTQTLGYNRYVHRLDADVGELPFLKKKNYCWHVSQQPNGYNCGAFAMYNTCRFIRRPPLVFQEEDCSKGHLVIESSTAAKVDHVVAR